MEQSIETHKNTPQKMYMTAGHSKMFSAEKGIIAKSYSENEGKCYEILVHSNSPLQAFIPLYYGCCEIKDCPLIAEKPHSELYNQFQEKESDSSDNEINKTNQYQFILLKNLEENFIKPCMLDIKIGTRMHWDGAPPAKIARHEFTSKTTTSGSLGLRICGMRLYNKQKNNWIHKEKKWGKSLSSSTLFLAICCFFYNGERIRVDLLPSAIMQLQKIKSIIEQCTWRFWSSSLLFLYEGDNKSTITIHLIDFGNCNFSGNYNSPDESFLFGLNNLIACLTLLQNQYYSLSTIQDFLTNIS